MKQLMSRNLGSLLLLVGLGEGFRSGNQREMAEVYNHLRKAIEQMPGYGDSYNLLAILNLADTENLDSAIALVRKGISLAPHRKDFLLTLAQLQIRKEDFAGARSTVRALLAGVACSRAGRAGAGTTPRDAA